MVKVDNVTAGYGQEDILKNVTFEIHRGQTVAIVGESGSGKSTAARVITGLLPPRLGNIQLNGEVLPKSFKARNKDQLRHVQMIYQMADTALNPRQRIRSIIGRPLSFYLNLTGQKREERIRELLSLIELEPDLYIDRFPDELSGGQKQRVSIARALAAEPEFIICDEVTSALDQLVAEGILRLLDRLQREFNLAYMFITHDLATVKAIADNVVVMLQGSIVEQGPKKDVFSPPHHEYTELLLSSVPEMDPDWLNELIMHREKHGVMASTSTS
ncbi:MAG: ATP-binding cassette domain-containing protein [Arenicellales bacterium]